MSIDRVNRIYLYIKAYQNCDSVSCEGNIYPFFFALHNIGTSTHFIFEDILNTCIKVNTVFGVLYRT